jgi:GNAT superfamily N-acetyltransferase
MKVKKQKASSITNNIFTSAIQTASKEINDDELLDIIKLETVDVIKLKFKVLTLLAEKKKWMHRFRKSYSEELGAFLDSDYAKHIKFVVATFEGKEVGFLRIVDWQGRFAKFTHEPAANISEGYVKPAYQGQGVLRAMIIHAINACNAISLSLNNDRAAKYGCYYRTLGFTHQRKISTTDCSRLYLTTWEPFVTGLLGS